LSSLNLRTIGNLLRKLRESKQLLLREVGAQISIDPSLLSKMEQNKRMPTYNQIKSISNFYFDHHNEIITTWLSDKLVNELLDHSQAVQAIDMAKEKILDFEKNDKNEF